MMLHKDSKKLPLKDRFKVWVMLCIYLGVMAYYTNYINVHSASIGYGIPGADMLAHFQGAEALARGARWTDLALIASRFEKIGISTIGYFLYTSFLHWSVFVLPIFDIGTNVYLVYVFQLVLSLDACVRYNRFFRKCNPQLKNNSCIYVLALCVPFVIQASQLMRDIYYMWFMAVLLEFVTKYYTAADFIEARNITSLGKRTRRSGQAKLIYYGTIGLLMVICVCFRFYSAIVFIPLVLYYTHWERLGMLSSVALSGVFLVGFSVLDALRQIVGIPWSFTTPDIMESVQFFLFPNVFNQSKYLLDWYRYFGTRIDPGGCNVPGIYYAMSVWNIWVIPLVFLGLAVDFKKHKQENLMWGSILLNIVLLYSVAYDAIDNRHKFFMAIPLCYLAQKGRLWLKRKGAVIYLAYNSAVVLLVLFVLLLAW